MDSFLLDGVHVDPWTIYFVWGEMIDKLWDSTSQYDSPLVNQHNYGKSQFNSYLSLPEGSFHWVREGKIPALIASNPDPVGLRFLFA